MTAGIHNSPLLSETSLVRYEPRTNLCQKIMKLVVGFLALQSACNLTPVEALDMRERLLTKLGDKRVDEQKLSEKQRMQNKIIGSTNLPPVVSYKSYTTKATFEQELENANKRMESDSPEEMYNALKIYRSLLYKGPFAAKDAVKAVDTALYLSNDERVQQQARALREELKEKGYISDKLFGFF
jgi:hypothetical protein